MDQDDRRHQAGPWRRPRLLVAIALGLATVGRVAAQAVPTADPAETKSERGFEVNGSFRLRYEHNRYNWETEGAERTRARFRFRVGVLGRIEERFAVGVRLASGSDSPTSSNIDIGDPIDGGAMRFDQAFLRYAPAGWVTLWAGKVPNPLVENRLLWDKDVNPRGLAQQVAVPLSSGGTLFANLGEFVLAEAAGVDNPEVWTAQLGAEWTTSGTGEWTAAVTYYDYLHLDVAVLPHGRLANSRTAGGLLLYDFDVVALYAAYRRAGRWPVEVVIETSENLEAPGGSNGVGAQVRVGKNRRPRDWSAAWVFQRLERDATPDALSESGWHDQGANYSGHQLQYRYSLRAGWFLTGSVREMRAIAGPRDEELQLRLDSTWDF